MWSAASSRAVPVRRSRSPTRRKQHGQRHHGGGRQPAQRSGPVKDGAWRGISPLRPARGLLPGPRRTWDHRIIRAGRTRSDDSSKHSAASYESSNYDEFDRRAGMALAHNRAGLGGTGRTLAVTALPCGLVRIMASSGVIALAGSGALLAACGTATGPVTARPASPGRSMAVSPARAAGAGEAGSAALARSSRNQVAAPAPPRPLAGNPAGGAPIPAAARPVDTSHPDQVIGNGTVAGCTSAAVVAAVAKGGVITFDCGAKPVTIMMQATAKVRTTSSEVVLDGGGKVTLSGGGARRILYMDTCDP